MTDSSTVAGAAPAWQEYDSSAPASRLTSEIEFRRHLKQGRNHTGLEWGCQADDGLTMGEQEIKRNFNRFCDFVLGCCVSGWDSIRV